MNDEDFIRELRGFSTSAFVVLAVRIVNLRSVKVQFETRADQTVWELVLPLPSAAVLKPWLYAVPDDAVESVRMFGRFLDEEILTTAIDSARSVSLPEATLVELAPYGLRRADHCEHARLTASADSGGWDGRAGSELP